MTIDADNAAAALATLSGQPPTALYWVSTPGAVADWFVIAASAGAASRFVELLDGFEASTCAAENVAPLAQAFLGEPTGWPPNEAVLASGGRFLSHEMPRKVAFRDRVFTEGSEEFTGKPASGDEPS